MIHQPNRRKVLAALGSATIAGSGPNTVTATNEKISMSDVGITEEVDGLLSQREFDEAAALLEKHDVDYDINTQNSERDANDDGAVSPTDVIEGDAIDVSLTGALLDSDDNVYRITLSWDIELDSIKGVVSCTGPDDVAAITYSGDLWQHEPGSQQLGEFSSDFEPSGTGCSIRFDDHDWLAVGNPGEFEYKLDIEKTEPGEHNVYGHFSHSWEPCLGGYGGLNFSLGIGELSVSTTGTVKEWTEPSPTIRL